MSTSKNSETTTPTTNDLELRKIKALEKIANSLDSLTIWFEEIEKDEWSQRAQFYLAEFHNKIVKGEKDIDVS
jgi:hypothetical protein